MAGIIADTNAVMDLVLKEALPRELRNIIADYGDEPTRQVVTYTCYSVHVYGGGKFAVKQFRYKCTNSKHCDADQRIFMSLVLVVTADDIYISPTGIGNLKTLHSDLNTKIRTLEHCPGVKIYTINGVGRNKVFFNFIEVYMYLGLFFENDTKNTIQLIRDAAVGMADKVNTTYISRPVVVTSEMVRERMDRIRDSVRMWAAADRGSSGRKSGRPRGIRR